MKGFRIIEPNWPEYNQQTWTEIQIEGDKIRIDSTMAENIGNKYDKQIDFVQITCSHHRKANT